MVEHCSRATLHHWVAFQSQIPVVAYLPVADLVMLMSELLNRVSEFAKRVPIGKKESIVSSGFCVTLGAGHGVPKPESMQFWIGCHHQVLKAKTNGNIECKTYVDCQARLSGSQAEKQLLMVKLSIQLSIRSVLKGFEVGA